MLTSDKVYFHQMANELPALPEAAQSRLRFSLTELRAEVEAKEDLWPGSKVQSTEVSPADWLSVGAFWKVIFCIFKVITQILKVVTPLFPLEKAGWKMAFRFEMVPSYGTC